MKKTELIMGMPVTVEIVGPASAKSFVPVFDYFRAVDARYSTYKSDSEISQINRGLPEAEWSPEMRAILALCELTHQETHGYFNIERHGRRDPSGLVKGWAIHNAAIALREGGIRNFYIDAGGDIQVHGKPADKAFWSVGIRNPFNTAEIVKTLGITTEGVATSGNYIRGQHIYNPHDTAPINDVKSLTVIGPNIYEADRFATAAFAMGGDGIAFVESLPGLEGYMIADDGIATYTSGFERYVVHA